MCQNLLGLWVRYNCFTCQRRVNRFRDCLDLVAKVTPAAVCRVPLNGLVPLSEVNEFFRAELKTEKRQNIHELVTRNPSHIQAIVEMEKVPNAHTILSHIRREPLNHRLRLRRQWMELKRLPVVRQSRIREDLRVVRQLSVLLQVQVEPPVVHIANSRVHIPLQ
jgi:hypothetical protein